MGSAQGKQCVQNKGKTGQINQHFLQNRTGWYRPVPTGTARFGTAWPSSGRSFGTAPAGTGLY
jgi:hypothetical protein